MPEVTVPPAVPARRRGRALLAALGTLALAASLFQPTVTSAAAADFIAPVVAYDFEGTVADVSGNGNDGSWRQTSTYPARYVDGVDGQAMYFQRGQSFVNLPAGVKPSAAGMSVSMWVRETEHSSDGALFGNLDYNNRTNAGFLLGHVQSTAPISAVAGGNGVAIEVVPTAEVSTWTHVVATLDEATNTMRVYRNGVLTQTKTYGTGKDLTTSYPFRIGTDGVNVTNGKWASSWMSGYVDSFRFFNAPISAAQALAEYGRYDVTVNGDAHGTATATPTVAAVGSTVTLAATAAEGYHLASWDAPTGVTVTDNSFVMPEGPVTIGARFAENEYTVKYDGNGSDAGTTATSTHSYDTAATLTHNGFTRAGYRFAGWATTSDGPIAYADGESVTRLTAVNAATVTLYARWLTADERAITVKENAHGTVTVTPTAEAGDTVTPVATPADGYHFVAWSSTPVVEFADGAFVMPDADVALSAEFAANTYTVVYDGNGAGAGVMAPSTHSYDAEAPLTANKFSLGGMAFAGWNTAADGTGTSYGDSAVVKNLTATNGGSVTLFARWARDGVIFGANADIHNNWTTLARTFALWKDKGVDAGVLVGDLTNSGAQSEVRGLLDALAANRGDVEVVASRGNHDGAASDADWLAATGNTRNQDVVVNGYHFLVAECNGSQAYTSTTKTFLDQRLKALTAEDAERPVFVLAHCPLPLTVYASVLQGGGYYGSGLGQGNTSSVFDAYPQAVVLSGHIHYPNRIPTAIWQDKGWTAMNVPSENSSYYGEAPGGESGTSLGSTVDVQTTIVEVVGSTVTVKQYDLATGEQDGPTWSWNAADKKDRPYTDARSKTTLRPAFAAGATATIGGVSATGATATVPSAAIPAPNPVDDIVHHYSWRVVKPGSSTAVTSGWSTSGWFRDTPPTGSRSFTASGLQACTEYEFQVTAANAWHQNSDALKSEFYTAGTCAVTVSDSPGGTATADRSTAAAGATVTLTATPAEGYHFVRWESDRGVEVASDGRFGMPAGPVTVTPVFALNTYTIAFDANGGAGSQAALELDYNEKSSLPAATVTRSGYTFAGWATARDSGVVYQDRAAVSNLTSQQGATVTLYAVWTALAGGPGNPTTGTSPTGTTPNGGPGQIAFTGSSIPLPLFGLAGLLLLLGAGLIWWLRRRGRVAESD